jgi:uncharacterized membrane protein YvbJ
MPYCANCGAKLERIESFCPYCGEVFKNIPKISEPSADSQIEVLKSEISSIKQQLQDQKKPMIIEQRKPESVCYICCCIVIFFLILISFIPWFIF